MRQFRIKSWNCFGMGQGVFDAITAWRAPEPARLLHEEVETACAAPTVLCVQELLSHGAQRFFDAVGESTFVSRFRDHNRPSIRPATLRGTGLGIASRSPLVHASLRHYLPLSSGWDKLARKGVLHARLELEDGPEIDVVNTHLQAGDDDGAIAVRASQLRELGVLLPQLGSPARPFVVCGDFNVDGLGPVRGGDEYRRLVAALDGFADLGAEQDLATYEPGPDGNTLARAFEPEGWRKRIDYVFFRPAAGSSGLRPTRVDLTLHGPLATPARPAARDFASDHFGLCASFEYLAP